MKNVSSWKIGKAHVLPGLLAAFGLLVGALPAVSRAQSDINLTGYSLTFDDEFNTLSLSTTSPKGSANWYGYPPNGSTGDFSSSTWNPTAFTVSNGILSDTAWIASGTSNWDSGYMASVDTTGAGFTQTYGYFEIRCQMPNSGDGAWPAFWLDTTSGLGAAANEEIDIFEWYGVCNTPGSYQAVMQEASHNWEANGSQDQTAPYLYSPGTPMPGGAYPWQAYHIYGCQVDPVHVTWYIDGTQTNQIATPTAYITTPFWMIVDYALGGGWPLTGMVNNSALTVDWVRVWSLPTSGTGSSGSIGLQFVGQGTALTGTQSAGASGVTQTNWQPLTGSTFSNVTLQNNSGSTTTAVLSGSADGTYFSGNGFTAGSGNASLSSGELFDGPFSSETKTLTVSSIPYGTYDVYLYTSCDAAGRDATYALTPSGGSAQYYSLQTENNGSSWTITTNAWNGSGTPPSLPVANCVHYAGLTASSFTLKWGSNSSNVSLNGIQIVSSGTSSGSAPSAPAGLTATAGNAQVSLSWGASSGATSYNVYQGTNSGGESSTPIATGISSTSYTNTGLANGTTYYYKVAAVNNSGTSGYSNEASATPASSGTGGPSIGMQFVGSGTAMTGTQSAGSVAQTNWQPLTGSTFTNVALQNNSGSSTSAVLSGSADGTYFSGNGFTVGSGNATLASGELFDGPFSSETKTLTVSSIPYGTYDVYLYAACDAAGRDATYALTPSGGGAQYYSLQTENNGSSWSITTNTWNGSGTPPSLPVANCVHYSGLTASSFSLKWGSNSSNVSLNGIQIVSTSGGGSAPSAPTGLTATAGNAQVSLSWGASSGATSYNVYQGTSSGGESSTPIATGISSTSYTNTGLANGTTYYYKVAAVNSSGTSGYSNEASATPSTSGSNGNPIGIQFVGAGTAMTATQSAGSVAQTNWEPMTGSSFSSVALTNSAGVSTGATLSGSADGTYFCESSFTVGSGNSTLASGELYDGSLSTETKTITVSSIPYSSYDVYLYAECDAGGRDATFALTPSGGSAQYYSLQTESNGSSWTITTNTWNGSGTPPSLPVANCVHYSGVTGSSFTLKWGSNSSNVSLNGIQIVPE